MTIKIHDYSRGPGGLSKEELYEKYQDVYDTDEVQKEFKVTGFFAPFVSVERRSDRQRGVMEFQHDPRFYFNFNEE